MILLYEQEEQDYSQHIDVNLWKKILVFCKPHKAVFYMLIISGLFLALTDALFPLFTGFAIDHFVINRDFTHLPPFIMLYIVLILVKCLTVYLFIDLAGKAETHVSHDVRERGYEQVSKLSFSYFDNTPVGWIMARLTSDTFRIGDIIAWSVIDIIWSVAIIVFSVGFMLVTNLRLTLLVLLIVPPMVVLSRYFQKKILKGHRESRKYNSQITGAFNEGIGGAKTTKTLLRERKNAQEFNDISEHMEKASIHASTMSALYFPIIMSLTGVGIAIVLGEGGRNVINQVISLGTLTVFITYATQLNDPIMQIAHVLSQLKSAQAAAERTLTLIDTDPDIMDSEEIITKYGDFMNPKPEAWRNIIGDITFDKVSFQYKTGEKVLEDFSLTVKAGEKIALVGETGSGKSTIVNLLCRFYEPTGGRILIDGIDYRESSQIWLQSNLGYVLQSPHLFSGSIADNIRYGKLNATMEEVEAVAKTVNAYDFIMKMEHGFDSEVGEGGSRLSTGEKQLISFARAIIGSPKLFILDEATSSIDTETEQAIQQAIYSILEGRTSFIVAHRLSTIRYCDRILVIEEGKIKESGTHKELLKKKGHYYQLYTNQFMHEKAEEVFHASGSGKNFDYMKS